MPTAPCTAIDAAASSRVASAGAAEAARRSASSRNGLPVVCAEPGAQLDRRPVVLAAAEADEDGAVSRARAAA